MKLDELGVDEDLKEKISKFAVDVAGYHGKFLTHCIITIPDGQERYGVVLETQYLMAVKQRFTFEICPLGDLDEKDVIDFRYKLGERLFVATGCVLSKMSYHGSTAFGVDYRDHAHSREPPARFAGMAMKGMEII